MSVLTIHFGPDPEPKDFPCPYCKLPNTKGHKCVEEIMIQYKPNTVVDIGNGEWAMVLEVTKNQVIYFPIGLKDIRFSNIEDFNNTVITNNPRK